MSSSSDSLSVVKFETDWDAERTRQRGLDLDLAAFALGADDKVLADNGFVFFNNAETAAGAIRHTGGDSPAARRETLFIDTAALPAEVASVAIAVSVYAATASFSGLADAYIRASDAGIGALCSFDLSAGFPAGRAAVYAKVYRDPTPGGEVWRMVATDTRYKDLLTMAASYGVNVG